MTKKPVVKKIVAAPTGGRNKGQEVKYQAYLKSVKGDVSAADAMFKIYMEAQPKAAAADFDKVAVKIEETLAILVNDKTIKLGNKGYTIRKAKGKGASGFVATKNE